MTAEWFVPVQMATGLADGCPRNGPVEGRALAVIEYRWHWVSNRCASCVAICCATGYLRPQRIGVFVSRELVFTHRIPDRLLITTSVGPDLQWRSIRIWGNKLGEGEPVHLIVIGGS